MKRSQLYKPRLYLLFILLLTISCNTQSKSNLSKEETSEKNIETSAISQDKKEEKAGQIGEYIVEIFEDSKGNLWFGTVAMGVARYDGKTLTYFTQADGLCGNTVVSVAEDKAGNLWFGTHTGASRYDGNTFTNFASKEGLHGAGCNILIDSDDNIWAGTNDGLFRYNNLLQPNGQSSFSKFDIPNPEIENPSYKWERGKVWGLREDSKGNIWIGRDGFGLCKYDGESFTHFTKKDGLCSNNVSAIQEDKDGNMWFGSITSDFPKNIKEGGLNFYDGTKIITFPELEGLINNDIYHISQDKSGKLWIGAVGFGVYHYDDGMFTLYKETDRMDLTNRMGFQSFVEDKNGTLWLGFSGGLFRFEENSIVNITKEDLLKDLNN